MNIREKICAWLFEKSERPYRFLFKQGKKAWNLSSADLARYPKETLGYATSQFLIKNNFELLDKLESHDVMHVLLEMKTTVKEEIGMQFLLLGNGKKSAYMYATIMLGYILQLEHYKYFSYCYRRGKTLHPVHKIDFFEALKMNSEQLRNSLKKTQNFSKSKILDPITF